MIFLIRGLFLDGAMDGLGFLFRVDWSKLADFKIWYRAANQILFQFSMGIGLFVAFASYNKKSESILKVSYIIPVCVASTGLLCALTIFTYMGYMANTSGIPI